MQRRRPVLPDTFMGRHVRVHAGADPTKLIEDLGKRKKVRTLGVSMGQGQEIIARRLLASAIAEGQWLLLQHPPLRLAYLADAYGGSQGSAPSAAQVFPRATWGAHM